MANLSTYTFVKNIAGTLIIDLETYDMMGARKSFRIPHNVKEIVVPHSYALGLFVSYDALNQYKMGYFTIKNEKELIREAIDLGLYAQDDRPDIVPLSEIEKAIKTNNAKFIKDILDRGDKVEVDNLCLYAKENIDSLTGSIVDMIENALGVELRIEG